LKNTHAKAKTIKINLNPSRIAVRRRFENKCAGCVPFDQLGGAEHDVRQGRLDKFPSGNGSNGFREIGSETHSDVLDENLLQRLACRKERPNIINGKSKESKLTAAFNAEWIYERKWRRQEKVCGLAAEDGGERVSTNDWECSTRLVTNLARLFHLLESRSI